MDAPNCLYTLTAFDEEGDKFHERARLALEAARFLGNFFAKRGARAVLRAETGRYEETYAPDPDAERQDGEPMPVKVTVKP